MHMGEPDSAAPQIYWNYLYSTLETTKPVLPVGIQLNSSELFIGATVSMAFDGVDATPSRSP